MAAGGGPRAAGCALLPSMLGRQRPQPSPSTGRKTLWGQGQPVLCVFPASGRLWEGPDNQALGTKRQGLRTVPERSEQALSLPSPLQPAPQADHSRGAPLSTAQGVRNGKPSQPRGPQEMPRLNAGWGPREGLWAGQEKA